MRKIIIQAPSGIAAILEEKLRHAYEVKVEVIPDNPKAICQIMANKQRKWITICRFASDEHIKDIITMFDAMEQETIGFQDTYSSCLAVSKRGV